MKNPPKNCVAIEPILVPMVDWPANCSATISNTTPWIAVDRRNGCNHTAFIIIVINPVDVRVASSTTPIGRPTITTGVFFVCPTNCVASNLSYERVRVVTEPWSDYTRFGLNLSRLNTAAGEDIRYIARDRAVELGLPTYDYWLLDSHKMCILRHDDQGVLLGADVMHDPAVVVEHAHYRDIARRFALPRADYLGTFDDEFLRKNNINK